MKTKTFYKTSLTFFTSELMFLIHWPEVDHEVTKSCKVGWKEANRTVPPGLTNRNVLPGVDCCYRGKAGD